MYFVCEGDTTDPKSRRKITKQSKATVVKQESANNGGLNTGWNKTNTKQAENRNFKRGIADKAFLFVNTVVDLCVESCSGNEYLWMGGELGYQTDLDLLLVYSAPSPQIFPLTGNDDFYSKVVLKRWWCLWVFARVSRQNRVRSQGCSDFPPYILLSTYMHSCVRVSDSYFQVRIRSGQHEVRP